jgi:hypothetical protein
LRDHWRDKGTSHRIDVIDLQFEKHDKQGISTPRGIAIDLRIEPWNVRDSMRLSRESFSNEIGENDLQNEKHNEQRISAIRGLRPV